VISSDLHHAIRGTNGRSNQRARRRAGVFDSNRGQEATPIVTGGITYVSTAWSRVYALDAGSGRELWRFDPHVPGREGFDACCDVVSRGVAVADRRVFLAALDGRLIALDAAGPMAYVQLLDEWCANPDLPGLEKRFTGGDP
jgi:outer membrane protein assembly factor BamB